jgi:hypothetical protein
MNGVSILASTHTARTRSQSAVSSPLSSRTSFKTQSAVHCSTYEIFSVCSVFASVLKNIFQDTLCSSLQHVRDLSLQCLRLCPQEHLSGHTLQFTAARTRSQSAVSSPLFSRTSFRTHSAVHYSTYEIFLVCSVFAFVLKNIFQDAGYRM